jgi:hypothetical protein
MNFSIMFNIFSRMLEHSTLIVMLTFKSLSLCFNFLLPMSFVKALRKEMTFHKNKTKNRHPSQDLKECVCHALMTKNKKQKSLPHPTPQQEKKNWTIWLHVGLPNWLP